MLTGTLITVSPADCRLLLALVKNRIAALKHIWHGGIVLLSPNDVDTNAIISKSHKSKT